MYNISRLFFKVKMTYEVGLDFSIMSDDTFMCKWHMGTLNLVSCGGAFEVSKHGMLFATFSTENKLRQLELSFDVMSFMQQLRRTSDRGSFQVREFHYFHGWIMPKITHISSLFSF